MDNDHTKVIEYYLEKKRMWNYFKECIIAQVAEPLWIVDGLILKKTLQGWVHGY